MPPLGEEPPLSLPPIPPVPKGSVVLIGGNMQNRKTGETLPDDPAGYLPMIDPHGIIRNITNASKNAAPNDRKEAAPRVVIVTLAAGDRAVPHAKDYADEFSRLGMEPVLLITSREGAQSPETEAALEKADVVFLGGGDQKKLMAGLSETKALACIKGRFLNDPSFTVAGTSAGAMALGRTMPYGNTSAPGFGLLPFTIDTHANRPRTTVDGTPLPPRGAVRAVAAQTDPEGTSIALDEGTALRLNFSSSYAEVFGAPAGGVYFLHPGSDDLTSYLTPKDPTFKLPEIRWEKPGPHTR